jgi:2'-5' RNA ligase
VVESARYPRTKLSRVAKKSLFFSLWPNDEVRAQIAVDAQRAIEGAGAQAVPPANYHITLAFLGLVSASSLPDIKGAISNVRFLPCEISLDHTGYWPRSRVAWLAPTNYPLVLSALVDDIWNKLAGLGFQADGRQYLPHVSLCRDVSGGLGMRLKTPIVWPVASFVLAEANSSAQGSDYTVLEQFPAGD